MASGAARPSTMRALVYLGPGQKNFVTNRPIPQIKNSTDAIVKMTHSTICGTDLHILKGDVATCKPGTVLGHEGCGIVDSVGSGVTAFRPGDLVLISCITSCSRCDYCKRGMYSHCTSEGGWILGNQTDGTQAEFVRIPNADGSLYHIPHGANPEALTLLSDIFPTGYECGVLNGKVTPGCSVAIIGAGPVGLAALMTACFYSPAEIIMVDLDDNRLSRALQFGATKTVNSAQGNQPTAAAIKALTNGIGVDVAIEAVGIPATFELCQDIVAPGGCIANVGVHGRKCDLHLETLWAHNITITTRLVDTSTTSMLLKTVMSKKLDPLKLVTHRFQFGTEMLRAYEVFGKAAQTQALKVLLLFGQQAPSAAAGASHTS